MNNLLYGLGIAIAIGGAVYLAYLFFFKSSSKKKVPVLKVVSSATPSASSKKEGPNAWGTARAVIYAVAFLVFAVWFLRDDKKSQATSTVVHEQTIVYQTKSWHRHDVWVKNGVQSAPVHLDVACGDTITIDWHCNGKYWVDGVFQGHGSPEKIRNHPSMRVGNYTFAGEGQDGLVVAWTYGFD